MSGDAVEPAGGAHDPRVDAARWLVAGACGAATVAALEWLILLVEARDLFASPLQMAGLLPLAIGNAIPYALVAASALLLADVACRFLESRVRRPRLVVVGAAVALGSPYAVWLGDYIFSGPRASALAHRWLWVAACELAIVLGFGAAAWLAVTTAARRRWLVPTVLGRVAATAVLLWLGRNAYPNEYEPLHGFLGGWSILLAVLAAWDLTGVAALLARRRRALLPAVAGVAVAWSIIASVLLARGEGYASLVWRETGASRWVTRRWLFLRPARPPGKGGPPMVLKPVLETRRTASLRKKRAAERAPDIVIFNIDGLRCDHVGAYGYEVHPTTPNIDRFAARGVRFLNAFSSYPATQAFNSALLLGRWVSLAKRDQQPAPFRAQAITRLLDGRGYHVFVKSWFELSKSNRFDPAPFRFDTYIQKSSDKEALEGPPEEWLTKLEAHIAEADAGDQPVFAWMHLLFTHPVPGGAFVPDPAFPFGPSRMDAYDSAIAGSDRLLARVEQLFAARAEAGRSTIWILGSDHGTNTGKASRDLYDGVARVPLVVVMPGVEPRTEPALVDTSLDLAATVVDLAGIAPPASYDGVSLVPVLLGEDAQAMRDRIVPLSYRKLSGAVYGGFKMIRDRESLLLFDLGADPKERRNLVQERADLVDRMVEVTDAALARRRKDARGRRDKSGVDALEDDDDAEDGEGVAGDDDEKPKEPAKRRRRKKR